MKQTRNWLSMVIGLLFVVILAGCTGAQEKAPAPPKWDDLKAGDFVMTYELHKYELIQNADPTKFVTGAEKEWLDQFLAERKAGTKFARPTWIMGGGAFAVTKQDSRELELQISYPLSDGKMDTIYYKLIAVNGEWKVGNHAGPDKKYLPTPEAKK